MNAFVRIANWPLAWKVPLLAAGLMIGVAVLISQLVLSRLASDQESNLRLLTSAYLDGLSAAVLPAAQRADVWEAFDALDRARSHYTGVNVRFAILERANGTVLAASDPLTFPVQSAVPAEVDKRFPPQDGLVIDNKSGRAWLSRTLRESGFSIGRILAEIDISELLRVRRQVLLTLVAVNAALALGFAAVGSFALKRMLEPLSVFGGYMERLREGRADPIPASKRRGLSREFDRLFDRFNAMARALNDREELASRLAEQERYAVLGKLAAGMAHEVNNPLGGLFNALDTLRRHGDDVRAREATLNLLQRGLSHIRNVVRSSLVNYRRGDSQHSARAVDIDDLHLAYRAGRFAQGHSARRGSTKYEDAFRCRREIRQATLNLLINACAATPPGGVVRCGARHRRCPEHRHRRPGTGNAAERVEYLLGRPTKGPRRGRTRAMDRPPSRRRRTWRNLLVQESGLKTVVRILAVPKRNSHSRSSTTAVEETIDAE